LYRGREQGDEAGEHQAGGHRGEPEAAGQAVHQVEAAEQEEGDGECQADGAAHQGQADGGPGVFLGAGVALRVVDPDELGGQIRVERAEFDEPGQQEIVLARKQIDGRRTPAAPGNGAESRPEIGVAGVVAFALCRPARYCLPTRRKNLYHRGD
jgi:hypothetical protein